MERLFNHQLTGQPIAAALDSREAAIISSSWTGFPSARRACREGPSRSRDNFAKKCVIEMCMPSQPPLDDIEEFEYDGPSKSQRKRDSTDLQTLGEALIALPENELEALPLPEILRDAVMLARRITAHGGLYRQKQYIGKLMRKFDAEPIRAAIEHRRELERLDALRFRRVEQWRDRLIAEGPTLIQTLIDEHAIELDEKLLTSLIGRARHERERGSPPTASRELFRELRDALASQPDPTL